MPAQIAMSDIEALSAIKGISGGRETVGRADRYGSSRLASLPFVDEVAAVEASPLKVACVSERPPNSRQDGEATLMTSLQNQLQNPPNINALQRADVAVRAAITSSYGRLRNYLQKHLSSRSDAEEVLQVFVLRALERSADVRDIRLVRGWLSRVLATTIVDFHRRRLREKLKEVPFTAEVGDRLADNQDADIESDICGCLHTHLSLLKAEHAEVIRRVDLAGETREAVAAQFGVTVNNLNVRLHRARQALRTHLESRCAACRDGGFLECRCGNE